MSPFIGSGVGVGTAKRRPKPDARPPLTWDNATVKLDNATVKLDAVKK